MAESINSTTQQERSDLIETRSNMATAVLTILQIAKEDDSPPTEDVIDKTIAAVIELLSVSEAVT